MSTFWCEGQDIKMNSSFNAYLLEKRPRLKRYRHHVKMERRMMLEDDVKEYWGFYLLKGSVAKLSVCSRHEGASFIVVKGLKDAKRCAYLGELDSLEESDEISNEFEFSHRLIQPGNNYNSTSSSSTLYGDDDNDNGNLQQFRSNSHELQKYANNVKNWSTDSKHLLLNKLLLSLNTSSLSEFSAYKRRDTRQILDNDDDDMEGAYEEFQDDILYDLHDQGTFNQKNVHGTNPVDKSREEVRSSWSSSEEALAACQGLIYNVPLNGATQCSQNNKLSEMKNVKTDVNNHTLLYNFQKTNFPNYSIIFKYYSNFPIY